MSFLEYLGLDYLFNEFEEFSAGGIVGEIISVIGFFGWIILILFGGQVVDQGIVVFNLLVAVILLLLLIMNLGRDFLLAKTKTTGIRKIVDCITLIAVVVAFIIGYTKPYHALLFKYEYTPIFSGIATTIYPSIIMFIIGNFIATKTTIKNKITGIIKCLGCIIFGFILAFFIGQFVTAVLFFTEKTSIYDKIAYYNDVEVVEQRKDWQYNSVRDYIYRNLPEKAKTLASDYRNENNLKGNEITSKMRQYLTEHFPKLDYGISWYGAKWENDTIIKFVIKDNQTNERIYLRFDYSTYTILEEITHEQFRKDK